MELASCLFTGVLLIALLCQYMSMSVGMGYGTALTPLLLILGFSPLQVVPVVLLSQFVGGTIGGVVHYRVGNIELDFRRDNSQMEGRLQRLGYLPRSIDAQVILIITACGVIGVLVGVVTAVNIPQIVLETYIGVMVLGIGLTILLRQSYKGAFSWRGLIALGLIGAFNKGLSGGGYVPLVVGGQIISGRDARRSLGSTTVAVTIVCALGFICYLLIRGDVDWMLAVAASLGSAIAAPFAALTVRKVKTKNLRFAIGVAIVILGTMTLMKTFLF